MSPVAIITGSDSGIGQESAKALAEAGNGGRAINLTSVNQDPACSHRQNKPALPYSDAGGLCGRFSRLWRSSKSALRP
jgi:NAD(P)-dependent dehydrogenase (short-subunit alcohol dehydrogenase family)